MTLRPEDILKSTKPWRRFERDSIGRPINRTSKIGCKIRNICVARSDSEKRESPLQIYNIRAPFERVQLIDERKKIDHGVKKK